MTPAQREEFERNKIEISAIARAREIDAVDAMLNGHQNAAPQWSAADHREASVHAMLKSFGLPVKHVHPLAEHVLRDGPYTILNAAETALELSFGSVPQPNGDGYNLIVQALATPDLPAIIQQTAHGVARERKSDLLDSILALSHQLEVRNYQAESYSLVDLDGLPAPSAETMNEYVFSNVRVTGEAVQVYSLFANILISRQALVNDDRNYVRAAVNAFLASAARNEMRTVVGKLEANANLADGAPLFGSSNSVTAVPTTVGGLGAAMAKLRAQPSESGDVNDATPATILVHSDQEAATLETVEKLPTDRRPRVIGSAHLSDASKWFLFADPELYPVIGRVRTEGADVSAISFGGLTQPSQRDPETGMTIDYNGLALPATHSVGYSVLSRVGVVRGTDS